MKANSWNGAPMNPIDLRERAFVITGSTGAIGFEIAKVFVEAGAAVSITGRDQAKCDAFAEQLRARAPAARVNAVAADLVNFVECEMLIQRAVEDFGRLDGMIHSAVGSPPGVTGSLEKTQPENYAKYLQSSLGILFNASRSALPALRQSGGGSIIAFVSDYGKVPGRNATMVSSTRSGAIMFMRSLALEVASDLIRCNCISPTFVKDTPIYEMMLQRDSRAAKATERAKLGLPNPTELAVLAAYLCSPIADKITGQVISMHGGLSAA
jgi:NAD(P)-dependent dehydrogenase (short-subunit alcohol dehydrogenase family)